MNKTLSRAANRALQPVFDYYEQINKKLQQAQIDAARYQDWRQDLDLAVGGLCRALKVRNGSAVAGKSVGLGGIAAVPSPSGSSAISVRQRTIGSPSIRTAATPQAQPRPQRQPLDRLAVVAPKEPKWVARVDKSATDHNKTYLATPSTAGAAQSTVSDGPSTAPRARLNRSSVSVAAPSPAQPLGRSTVVTGTPNPPRWGEKADSSTSNHSKTGYPATPSAGLTPSVPAAPRIGLSRSSVLTAVSRSAEEPDKRTIPAKGAPLARPTPKKRALTTADLDPTPKRRTLGQQTGLGLWSAACCHLAPKEATEVLPQSGGRIPRGATH